MERAAAMAMVLVTCLSVATTARAGADEQEIVTDGSTADAERQALKLALRALPRRPARIAVIDLTEAKPDVQATLRQLDAFVVAGSPVIYVVRAEPAARGRTRGVGHARPRARHRDLARDGACRRRRREPGAQAGRSALVELHPRSACRSRRRAALPGRAHAAPRSPATGAEVTMASHRKSPGIIRAFPGHASRRGQPGPYRTPISTPAPASPGPHPIRFGDFELDARSGELRNNGSRVVIAEQPLQVLLALIERPGILVTRDELRQRLWPGDTFVDFEHGLNAAVKRLRDVLGDSADRPRYIETVPRRGYRLIAVVQNGASVQAEPLRDSPPQPPLPVPSPPSKARWPAVVAGVLALVAILVVVRAWQRASVVNPPTPERPLTRLNVRPWPAHGCHPVAGRPAYCLRLRLDRELRHLVTACGRRRADRS